MEKIGNGQKTFDYKLVRGIWTSLEGPENVLDLMDKGLEGVIAVIRDAGATFLSPIFDELSGVICTENCYQKPYWNSKSNFKFLGIIAAELSYEPENGTEIILDGTGPEGLIYLAD